jgi:hypothetical protein
MLIFSPLRLVDESTVTDLWAAPGCIEGVQKAVPRETYLQARFNQLPGR